DVLHVERRILAHQHSRERRERAYRRLSDVVPVVIVSVHRERPHAGKRLASIPEDLGLLGREQLVPPRLQGTHHGHARVLVGLERWQGIENESDFQAAGRREAKEAPSYRISRAALRPSSSMPTTVPASVRR